MAISKSVAFLKLLYLLKISALKKVELTFVRMSVDPTSIVFKQMLYLQ